MIEIEMDSAVGPRVIYADGTTEFEVESELPSGWTVDYSSQVRTSSGKWSCPLIAARTYTVTGVEAAPSTCVDHAGAMDVDLIVEWSDGERWEVSVTLAPDPINGGMAAYGDSPDLWIDCATISRMRTLDRVTFRDMCQDLEAAAREAL